MLYLFSGTSEKRKETIRKLAETHSLTLQHIYNNDIQGSDFFDVVSVQTGLFGDKELYVFHNLCRDIDLKKILNICAESENIFVFSEDTLTKKITDIFSNYEGEIKDFGKETEKVKSSFNIFSLADALGKRDKKNLWILFQQAREQASPEEIHGVLFWQIKNLALVSSESSNPGMKSFLYTKNCSFAKNFSQQEIRYFSELFMRMFHERDTYATLDIELEKFILQL